MPATNGAPQRGAPTSKEQGLQPKNHQENPLRCPRRGPPYRPASRLLLIQQLAPTHPPAAGGVVVVVVGAAVGVEHSRHRGPSNGAPA